MGYKYYINKDYKEIGYISCVAVCQANIKQDTKLFEECKILTTNQIEEINSGQKLYTLKDKKVVEVDPTTLPSVDHTTTREAGRDNLELAVKALITYLATKDSKLPKELIEYAKEVE